MMKQGYRETCVHTKFTVNVEVPLCLTASNTKIKDAEKKVVYFGREERHVLQAFLPSRKLSLSRGTGTLELTIEETKGAQSRQTAIDRGIWERNHFFSQHLFFLYLFIFSRCPKGANAVKPTGSNPPSPFPRLAFTICMLFFEWFLPALKA